MKNIQKNNLFYMLAIVLVVIDQITKLLVKGIDILGIKVEGMKIGQSFELIGNFIQITYIENDGMAFGITFGAGKIFLSLFSIFASIFLIIYLSRIAGRHFFVRLGISIVLAGAVGNLIDRVFYGVFYGERALFYGRVVDFIQVDIPDITLMGLRYTHWPIFNVADMCVTIGVILLLIFHNHIPLFNEVFKRKKDAIEAEDELIIEPVADDK